jgi:predicted transcriptional regulator
MKINTRKIELELKRLGWSKYRLAKEMGCTPAWVYYLFQADNTSLKTIDLIASAMGLDPKDLII